MTWRWLAIVFVVALVSTGLPLWLVPYNRIELPSFWLLPGLLVIVPLAAGTRFLALAKTWATVGALTGAMIAANMLRVSWDAAADPTSHNLWPLELIMTAFAGVTFSLVGCLAGWLLGLVWRGLQRQ
jgi:hypothetical protein